MSDIGQEYRDLMEARRLKFKEAMNEYDGTVYYPALKELRARCAAAGHVKSSAPRHDNGFGTSWDYCGRCGAQMNILREFIS
jgi:hypothetical protein